MLGPLVTGAIQWRIHPTILSQLYGLDAVTLLVVAPVAAFAGVCALRGGPRARCWVSRPRRTRSTWSRSTVLGPDYAHLAGNNERWFPLLLALFIFGVVASALAWTSLRAAVARGSERVERLIGQWLLPAVATLVFVRYLPTLADWMSRDPQAKD